MSTKLNSLALRRARFERLAVLWQESMPDARCELYFQTPYQLLVSVILSAQATDISVNKAMESVYRSGLTPEEVLKLGEEGLLKIIKSIGLAPTKAKNILKTTAKILGDFSGAVPNNLEDLCSLPGVGRKTANVILGEVYGCPVLAVDTHVLRVSRRLGLHRFDSPDKVEVELMKVIDKRYLPKAHHWLILHGRYTCKARAPECSRCTVAEHCPSRIL
jgi:endonuclease-3